MRVLVATRSAHKLEEIREILGEVDGLASRVELVSLEDLAIEPTPEEADLEPWDTFEENAKSKANWYSRLTGLPVLADDSGLVVDALDGEPGVRSKRFSPGDLTGQARDDANNARILELLSDVPEVRRTARYVCAVVWMPVDGDPRVVRGEVEGRIAQEPEGRGGFGYDPIFFVPELGRTFGQSTDAEKHALSHRGRAFRAVVPFLRECLAGDR